MFLFGGGQVAKKGGQVVWGFLKSCRGSQNEFPMLPDWLLPISVVLYWVDHL